MSIRGKVLQVVLSIASAAGLLVAKTQAQQGLEGIIQLSAEPVVDSRLGDNNASTLRPETASRISSLGVPAAFENRRATLVSHSVARQVTAAPQAPGRAPPKLPDVVLDGKVRVTNTSMSGKGLVPPDGQLPDNRVGGLPTGAARGASFQCVHWAPSAICHYPLYFQDAMLERHGQTRFGCLQPIVSGAKFISTIPLLPYLATLQPPCESQYALGQYRPGTCAPVLRNHLPYDSRAAAVETLSLAGLFWAAPL